MNALRRFSSPLLWTAVFSLAPALAQAHPGHEAQGFAHGIAHPLSGVDHLLAMIAVGLWAAQLGGRAKWFVPAAFVSVMTLGGVLGMNGVPLPFVEHGILTSILLLGILLAASVKLPLPASMSLVGIFALFHGHAHGAEMPMDAGAFGFAAGFVLATAVLHLAGVATGLLMQRFTEEKFLRFSGLAICAAGGWLAFS